MPGFFGGLAALGRDSISLVSSAISFDANNLTSYEISAPSGSYAHVIAVFCMRLNTTGQISDITDTSDVTLGATLGASDSNGSQRVEIWAFPKASTFRVKASGPAFANLGWYLYGVNGLKSLTPVASSPDHTDIFDVSVNVLKGGFIAAGLMDAVTTHTYTSSGFTSITDQSHETSFSSIGGYFLATANESPHTMQIDVNTSNLGTAISAAYR